MGKVVREESNNKKEYKIGLKLVIELLKSKLPDIFIFNLLIDFGVIVFGIAFNFKKPVEIFFSIIRDVIICARNVEVPESLSNDSLIINIMIISVVAICMIISMIDYMRRKRVET